MYAGRGLKNVIFLGKVNVERDLSDVGDRIVLIRIDDSSVTLTPFGSVIRPAPTVALRGRAKSWTEKLRALFALFFR